MMRLEKAFALPGLFRRYAKNTRGIAAVEFALMAPAMLALMMTTYEMSEALTAYRRVTNVASTIGDLTAQDTTIDDGEMTDILNAGEVVLQPLEVGRLRMRIFSIVFDEDGDPSVAWADTRNWNEDSIECLNNIPEAAQIPFMSIVCAEAQYDYDSLLGYIITTTKEMRERYYLVPRRTVSITRVN